MNKVIVSLFVVLLLLVGGLMRAMTQPLSSSVAAAPHAEPAPDERVSLAPTVWASEAQLHAHLPPGAAHLKPIPVILPKELRDPAHAPPPIPVYAAPMQVAPPDPFTVPAPVLDPRRSHRHGS